MLTRSFVFLLLSFAVALPAGASLEGRLFKSFAFPEQPREIDISPDGKLLMALGKEKIYLATIQGQLLGEWQVGEDVSGIVMHSGNLVLLRRSGSNEVDYLALDVIQPIDLTGSPVKGNVDAPIAIVVFDDFQCPYCARLVPVLKRVLDNNPDKVKLVYKNFPLNMHKFAKSAALAASAAGRQGKFWEMHDLLFANYQNLNEQTVAGFAAQLDLDLDQFKRDRNDPTLAADLERDIQLGRQLGVGGTPTVFVNGRLLQDKSEAGFQRAVEAEWQRFEQSKE